MKSTLAIIGFILFNMSILIAQNPIESGVQTQFFYGNGKVSSEGLMRDGKPDGVWKTYYPSGQLKSIGKRSHFQLDSIWSFYNEQGMLTEAISYLNGKKSGYTKRYQSSLQNDSLVQTVRLQELYLDDRKEGQGFYYDDEGAIEKIIHYKNGKKHGLTRMFNSDSVITSLYKYHNDFLIDREFINQRDQQGRKQGLWKELYDNDISRFEAYYKDDVRHGYYREYSSRGELLLDRFYENGRLVQKEEEPDIKIDRIEEFSDDGKIIKSGGFKNRVPVGTHRTYDYTRSKVETTEYGEKGSKIAAGSTNLKGEKSEFWQFFYTDGQLRSEGDFLANKRHGQWKFYYPNGQLEQSGTYRNGVEDGLWIWYYPDGSIRREENYYRGREDGSSVEFDERGKMIAKGDYLEGLEEGEWEYRVGDNTEKGIYRGGEKDGLWVQSYKDGEKKFSGSYVQGYPNGRHRYFYEDGRVKEERYYELGRKEKVWRKFDKAGNQTLSLSYSKDNLIRINGVRVNLGEIER